MASSRKVPHFALYHWTLPWIVNIIFAAAFPTRGRPSHGVVPRASKKTVDF